MNGQYHGDLIQLFSSVAGSGFAFMKRLKVELEAAGWLFEEISAVDEIDYWSKKGWLVSWRLRSKMYPQFAWRLIAECRKPTRAVRIVTTNPFFAPWLALMTSDARIPVINLLYDVFPDALEVSGAIRTNSFLSKILSYPARVSIQKASATVFLGKNIQKHVEERYGRARYSRIIPVGADGAPFASSPPRPCERGEPVTLLYCGNMGQMHDFVTLAGVMREHVADSITSRLCWRFNCHGKSYNLLKTEVGSHSCPWVVNWQGALQIADWINVMKSSQVAVITMVPGAEKVSMPSKAYSAMVAGQAVMAICSSMSDLAEMVRKHDCGWIIEPGDVTTLSSVLGQIAENGDVLQKKRLNSFVAGHQYYDMKPIARQWVGLLEELR
jgi:glycosyltransferase involved in cell wall biosynthesis